MLYYLYRLIYYIIRIFPSSFVYFLARFAAFISFLILFKRRRNVLLNVKTILNKSKTDKEVIITGIKTFFSSALTIIDFLKIISFKNFEDFQKLLYNSFEEEKNRFIYNIEKENCKIFLTAHVGNWELSGVIFGICGYISNVIALKQPDKKLEEMYNKIRRAYKIVSFGIEYGLRSVFNALRKGEIAAIASDRDINKTGVKVIFFGKKASFPKGAAFLSFRLGKKAIPIFLVRIKDGKYKYVYGKPIFPETNKEDDFIEKFVKSFAKQLEDVIKSYPDQFLNFYNFWG